MSQTSQASAHEIVKATVQTVLNGIESGSIADAREQLEALALTPLASPLPAASSATIFKVDEGRRMVYGWALVSTVQGQEITDRQGDVVSTDEVRETAHDFIAKRTLGVMHENSNGIGEIRESIVLDANLQRALGIDLGMEGWFVGVHVKHQPTWERVLKGELRAFSIGGIGERHPLPGEMVSKAARQRVLASTASFARGPGRVALFTDVLTALEE